MAYTQTLSADRGFVVTQSAAIPLQRSQFAATLRGVLTDTMLPLALYALARHKLGCTEVQALLLTSALPIAGAFLNWRRHASLSPVSVLVLAGIVVSIAAMLLGGGTRLLLLRESLFTVALSVVCLLSVPTRRPLMFFFGRYFVAGNDPVKRAAFDAKLAHPAFLHTQRVITGVWGAVYLGEFIAKLLLVDHCSTMTVLAVSPLLGNGAIFGTIAWTVWYGKRAQARAQQQTALAHAVVGA